MPRTAIVTGGASGIGRAIGAALVRRGVEVVLADIDAGGAKEAAAAMDGPGGAEGAALDVRDADAVAALVGEVRGRHGRLDFVFNNAGVGVGGDLLEIDLVHWERAIDVNLRGVVHGVRAAYPVMVEQGSGHIVNTASLSGLVPAPMLTPYATTKHAVVGLSRSLRAEAAAHGVRVTVVCPGVIDTPILDSTGPSDLPQVPSAASGAREMLVRVAGRPYPAESLAEDVLRGLARNKAVIVTPRRARAVWRLQRLAPGLVAKQSEALMAIERRRRGIG